MKKIHSSNIQMSEAFINNMFLAFSGGTIFMKTAEQNI